MRVERVQTGDGSWTLRDLDRGITFRSVHGAATESDHVFVEPSGVLDVRAGSTWRVLELGFGAAMNFHRTRLCAAEQGLDLHYVALERAPVASDEISHDSTTDRLVRAAFARRVVDEDGVRLDVIESDWQEHPLIDGRFDAVYHDPFGPQDNPEAWTVGCFRWSRGLVQPGGRLLTYAVAGHVRRALAAAGWVVEKRPGPPGKREVLVASPVSDAREGQ